VAIGPAGKEERVPIDVLGERARQALVSRQSKQVFLRMDASVTAQDFIHVFDVLKGGGVESIGIVANDAPDAVR
jgi:biopolymer transport protein ExbD